jgi:NIMA (never in mitosis gene a)-related kinase 1/4/5
VGATILKKSIGTGSFSEVYRVRRISDNREYALKKVISLIIRSLQVNMNKLSEKERENALNEVRILASIRS